MNLMHSWPVDWNIFVLGGSLVTVCNMIYNLFNTYVFYRCYFIIDTAVTQYTVAILIS